MDSLDPFHQAPQPDWMKESNQGCDVEGLKSRIEDLEDQVRSYEALLEDLPDLFERKFQQRLEPLLERYRLLAEQSADPQAGKPPMVTGSPTNVVRLPMPNIPALLRRRQRSA